MRWHADGAWYRPAATQSLRFIVFDTTENPAKFTAAAYAAFGPPDHIYHADRYTVLAWDHSFIPPGYTL